MKNRFFTQLLLSLLAAVVTPAFGGAFTQGNLVINRVGDGSAALSSAAAKVSVVELTTAGANPVGGANAFFLPNFTSGGNNQGGYTDSGSATSNGMMHLSVDGRYLTAMGIDAQVGTASVTGTTSAAANRNVAKIDASGTVTTVARLTDAFSGNNARSATTDTGTSFYIGGTGTTGTDGIRYVNTSSGVATTSTTVNAGNFRNAMIVADNSSNKFLVQASTTAIAYFAGFPTTTSTPTAIVFTTGGMSSGSGAFVFFDRDPGASATGLGGLDTLYFADGSAIEKYEWTGSGWTQRGSASTTTAAFGLTGRIVGGNVELYVTNSLTSNNGLFKITDSTGFGGTLSGAASLLASAGTNFAFRDVAFAPANPSSFSVTYNGNGNTGGTVPTDATTYSSGATVTVTTNSGSLVKTGSTFTGWNTAAIGSGTHYAADGTATFTINANTTLFAEWTINTYTLTYTASANGSISGTSPQTVNYNTSGSAVTAVPDTGYHFVNWSDSPTANPRTDTNVSANVGVTANFAINTYTVGYDGNGFTGGTAPTDASSPYDHGSTVTVLGAGSLVKTGYTFTGWNTAANGSGTAYSPSATFTITTNTTLYAQWLINSYTVTYDGNGFTGGTVPSDGNNPYTFGSTVTVLGPGSLVKTGFTFINWNTVSDGSGTAYGQNATFNIAANTTFFAQWSAQPTISGAATAAPFTTTYGTASAAQNFLVSGANLTADLVATAPSGFEVSNDGVTYGSTATFSQSGGIASGTLRIRLAANALVGGSYNSKAIVLSSTNANNVNITTATSGNTVSHKALTVTGLTGNHKPYDRTTAATFSGTAVLSGVETGDVANVTLSGTPSASFATAAVANGKTITVTGYTLTGSAADNYTVADTSLTANITAVGLTITGLTANNKPFDGNTTATLSGVAALNGVVAGDESSVTLAGTPVANFDTAAVGNNKPVTVTGYSLTGGAAGNYTLSQPAGLTANITPSANANLTSLTVSAGTLLPSFNQATTSYTVNVGNAVTSVTMIPTLSDANATVTVNGTGVNSGNASSGISLSPGDNVIPVVVTAQDTTTTKTYNVTFHRWAGFTAGNLAVFQADSSSANNTTATIVEVNSGLAGQTSASSVNAIAINGTTGGSALRFSGSATSTGYMSESADRAYITFTGHNTTTNSGNANTILPRGVGTLDISGAFALQTTYTGASGSQTRSATTIDDTNWFISDQGGIFTNGGTIPSPVANTRSIRAFGGTVYALQQSATSTVIVVSTVSAPTGGTIAGLPGLTNGSSATDFYLVSSGDNGSAYDVLYVVGDTSATVGTISKFSLVSGTWVANGTYTTTFGGFGIAAADNGNGALLYVTTGSGATGANSVIKLADTAGYNLAINITTANNVALYTAPAGTTLKGVTFAPHVTAPLFTTQPADQSISNGTTATLAALAIGNPAVTYQWYVGNSGDTSKPISGATSATYVTPALATTATYWVRATNSQGSVDSATVTVTVAAAVVTISATDASAVEATGDPGTFRITRTGATTNALTVSYTVATGAGQAVAADYTPTLSGTAIIPPTQSFVDITVTPVDDVLLEGDETVTLTIQDTADYDLGGTATASVTITDDETAIDLSRYVRVARYGLPHWKTTTPPDGFSLLCQEASSVTWNWDTDTLFIVGDGGTSIVQVSKTGAYINSMTLASGSSPQGTEFYDTEGITYVGGGKFVLVEERYRQVNLFTYVPNATLQRANVQTVKLGTTIGNVGIEGICFDPQTSGFIAVKEKDPRGIFQTGVDFNAGTATNGSPSTVNSTDLFDPALANTSDCSDIFVLANLSTLSGKPASGDLLLISQESGVVRHLSRTGSILNTLTITTDVGDSLTVPDMTMEGVTMDRNGVLYIVNENGGGDADHPQMWVYAPSTATNTAPTAITLNNATTSLPEDANTAAAIKLADVFVADDGLGTNSLSITGTDASFFQITGTALELKAGVSLSATTKPSYSITVNVDDATVGTTPDASTNYTLTITAAGGGVATLRITEVAPWSSTNGLGLNADWFEVTNVGTAAAALSGWKMNDSHSNSVGAVPLSGITTIAPGESVIFIESTSTNQATVIANFKTLWFGSNVPAGLKVGTYDGTIASVGLSTGGDSVNLFDGGGTLQASVAFGSNTASPFKTFDNAAGLNATTISLLSVVGTNGAFTATGDVNEIGSPGTISGSSTPIITIVATDASAAEQGTDPGTFRISRTGITTGNLTVNYTVATGAGQAVAADYTETLSGSAIIPSGSAFVDLTVTPVDDILVEGSETVTLTLFDTGNYDVGSPDTATVTITDNDIANQPPTAVVLSNTVPTLLENTSTASAVRVADISVTDDGQGTNTLSLTGADAASFEITSGSLYLRAGTTLDHLAKSTYAVTVNVDDTTVGTTPDATASFTLTIKQFVAAGTIIVSEVSPWSSTAANSPLAADWIEITNTGSTAVNITGWKMDDDSNSFGTAVALSGVTTIGAGESVIFIETATLATTAAAFRDLWFGANPPASLQVGNYTGSGVGLGGGGDSVNIFTGAGDRVTGIAVGASPAGPFATFDNAAGAGSTTLPLPTVNTLSRAGVNGAFVAAKHATETGSPGTIANKAPVITTNPLTQTIATGSSVTLTVTATAFPLPTYQWYLGASGDEGSPIASATSSSYTTPALISAASYWVKVTNIVSSASSTTAVISVAYGAPLSSTTPTQFVPNTASWNPAGVTVNGTSFVNLGLQGVGRVASNAVDPATGETLGSVSDMQITNWRKTGAGTYAGTFNFLPDRGYNSTAPVIFSNYAARINAFEFTFAPYTSSTPTTNQNQIAMTFAGSTRFTYDNGSGQKFTTGLNADATATLFGTTVPVASGVSIQSDGSVTNRLTLDSEGLALDNRPGKSGAGWVGDEYGAYIYHFNSQKQIDGQLQLPPALLPRISGGVISFDANAVQTSGRRINQGMEGLAQSPDGTKIFGLMQSATIQDSGAGAVARVFARLLVYNVSSTDTPNDPVAQYVIQLPAVDDTGSTTNGTSLNKTAAQSSILALNDHQILILSRDSNGRGVTGSASPVFKSILLADLNGATNIDGTYDAAGAAVAPGNVLTTGVTPLTWTEALNILAKFGSTSPEVAKFNLNLNPDATTDSNSISEKWEALGMVSADDPANPNDYFLFMGNDNDFNTTSIKYLDASGALQTAAGTVANGNDTLILAYRVRLTGTFNQAPFVSNTIPDQGAQASTPFSFAFAANTFTDPESGTLTYTATKADDTPLPTWLTFTPGTRTFSGTPTNGDVGTVTVKVTATDNGSPALFTSTSFSIAVSAFTATTYQIENATYSVAEDAGSLVVNVTRTNSAASADVTFTTTDGTAHAGVDFTAPVNPVHFNAGQSSVPVSIAITNLSGTPQGNRTFTAALTAVPSGDLIGGTAATITITEAAGGVFSFAAAPTLSVSPKTNDGTGSPTSVAVVINRGTTAGGVVTFNLAASAVTTAPAGYLKLVNGTDYTYAGETVTFTNGQTTKTVQIPLTATARKGQFKLSASSVSAGSFPSADLTIQVEAKDSVLPTLTATLSGASPTVSGATAAANLTLTATATDPASTPSSPSSGLNRVEVNLKNVSTPAAGTTTVYHAGTETTTLAGGVPVTLEAGLNTFTVTAFDNAGNAKVVAIKRTFVNTDLTSLAGTYLGLLLPANLSTSVGTAAVSNDNVGLVSVTVTATAAVSGKLMMSGLTLPFTGVLANGGTFRAKNVNTAYIDLFDKVEFESYLGALSFSVASGTATGTLKDGSAGATLATFTADKQFALPQTIPTSVIPSGASAKYTLALPAPTTGSNANVATFPQGDGYATITVTGAGVVSVRGKLADGTVLSLSNKLHGTGLNSVPLYAPLYRKKGAFAAELTFANATDSDVSGTDAVWIRPTQPRARYYKAGWANGALVQPVGTLFTTPTTTSILLGITTGTVPAANIEVQFGDGFLDSTAVGGSETRLGRIGNIAGATLNKFTRPPTELDPAFTLALSAGAGTFTGKFKHTDGTVLSYQGVVLQKGGNKKGFGYFLSTPPFTYSGGGQSGGVTILPLP
jgi:uncharacterized repeat protein (TIGR02543 family)